MIARVKPKPGSEEAVRAAVSRWIKDSGQPLEQLADVVERTRGSLNGYKQAHHTIPLDVAARLAAHFEISLEELAGVARPRGRSRELAGIAANVREFATTQEVLASELQRVAERLSHLGGQADDAEAGTG